MITNRKISLIRLDADGKKQLTRVLFEIETHEHLFHQKFIWLKVTDPTPEEMNQVINKLLKPELQKNLDKYDIDLLIEDLKRDYLLQKSRLTARIEAYAG